MNKENNLTRLVYYNGSFVNTTNNLVMAALSENRTTALVDKASNYNMSVVRFDVDTSYLPINIPLMQTGSQTITQSIITLTYLGIPYSQNIIYVDLQNGAAPIPVVYNYDAWLDYVNAAAKLAFNSTGVVGSPPIFAYNSVSGLINLYLDDNYIPSSLLPANKITISINGALLNYFYNFEFTANLLDPIKTYTFIVTNINTNLEPPIGSRENLPIAVQNIGILPPANNLYIYRQSAVSTSRWSSVRSLLLTSTLLPFKNESIPTSVTVSSNYLSSGLFPILTDFLIPLEDPPQQRVVEQYLPTAEYRRISLQGNDPITNIDLKFYWTDYLGNVYPLFLLPNSGMNVKILFERVL